jgi:hypothetical protein
VQELHLLFLHQLEVVPTLDHKYLQVEELDLQENLLQLAVLEYLEHLVVVETPPMVLDHFQEIIHQHHQHKELEVELEQAQELAVEVVELHFLAEMESPLEDYLLHQVVKVV